MEPASGRNNRGMRFALALLAVVVFTGGCGSSSDPQKQAEELQSIAAEGALLAHAAAEGRTTDRFTRAHGDALGKRLDSLTPMLHDEQLATLADDVGTALDRVPTDPERAERALERQADAAERLAG